MSIVVIGAGISGLAAAHRLQELGHEDIRILEASTSPGGLCKTVAHADSLFDLGPHQLHTSDPEIVALLRDILGDQLLTCKRRAGLRMNGKLLKYPLGVSDLFAGLSFGAAVASGFDFLRARLRRHPMQRTFREWVENSYGRRLYKQYFEPYTRKVWGRDPSELSADCAEQRLASQSMWDVIMSAFRSRRHQHSYLTHSPYQPEFYYPTHGIGMLVDKWSQMLRSKGVRLDLQSRVVAISGSRGNFTISLAEGQAVSADEIINTAPVDQLQASLRAGGHPAVPRETLPHRSLVFTMLGLKTAPAPDFQWIYFPESKAPFLRVTQFHRFSPDMAPDGQASICTEIACDHNDEFWTLPNDEAARVSIRALEDDGFISASDVTCSAVVREKHAYPLMQTGYTAILDNILDYVSGIDGLSTIGRQGAFKYLDVCDLIPLSYKAAELI